MRAIELFVGAGGLGLGVAKAGFTHDVAIEWDHDACETIRENQRRKFPLVSDWHLVEGDVSRYDYRQIKNKIDLVSGGPPCQPFSMGGKHRGHQDDRNMFPQAVRAVRELRPRAFMFENVRGLLRESFTRYYEYILLQLSYPEVTRGESEEWTDHLERLERYKTSGRDAGLTYNVVFQCLNAADFGVGQQRFRVFIVGFRSDLSVQWAFPKPTHSKTALLYSQNVSGAYWDEHKIPNSKRPYNSKNVKCEPKLFDFIDDNRWVTVRDRIHDLPDPETEKRHSVMNHRFIDGARPYAGHTGSPLDWPAKTLKAGDHGVPGGENMLSYPSGRVRYFTVRESARLQDFPDDYLFHGSWTESMRQLGNAVPVTLGFTVANSIGSHLEKLNGRVAADKSR